MAGQGRRAGNRYRIAKRLLRSPSAPARNASAGNIRPLQSKDLRCGRGGRTAIMRGCVGRRCLSLPVPRSLFPLVPGRPALRAGAPVRASHSASNAGRSMLVRRCPFAAARAASGVSPSAPPARGALHPCADVRAAQFACRRRPIGLQYTLSNSARLRGSSAVLVRVRPRHPAHSAPWHRRSNIAGTA